MPSPARGACLMNARPDCVRQRLGASGAGPFAHEPQRQSSPVERPLVDATLRPFQVAVDTATIPVEPQPVVTQIREAPVAPAIEWVRIAVRAVTPQHEGELSGHSRVAPVERLICIQRARIRTDVRAPQHVTPGMARRCGCTECRCERDCNQRSYDNADMHIASFDRFARQAVEHLEQAAPWLQSGKDGGVDG